MRALALDTASTQTVLALADPIYLEQALHNIICNAMDAIEAKEISAEGKSIFAHDPGGKVAEAYKNLTREVIKLEKQREKSRAGLSR